MEVCVILKFGLALPNFATPTPAPVLWGWIVFFACLLLWMVLRFDLQSAVTLPPRLRPSVLKGLVVLAVASLLNVVVTQDVGYGPDGRAAAAGW